MNFQPALSGAVQKAMADRSRRQTFTHRPRLNWGAKSHRLCACWTARCRIACVDGLMDGRRIVYAGAVLLCGMNGFMCTESLYDAFVEKAVAWVNALKLRESLDNDHRHRPLATCGFRPRSPCPDFPEAVAAGATSANRHKFDATMTAGRTSRPQILDKRHP